jgi:hypothetical protein
VSLVPLRLGALAAPGLTVQRSGVRWLCDDGHVCRPGEVIAYCNIGLAPAAPATRGALPFADEGRDFQVAFAPRVGGRLYRAPGTSLGGFLDQHYYYQQWTPDFTIGQVQCRPSERPPGFDPDGETMQLLFVAGRRTTEIAEIRSGLLTGWHDRARAWWGDGDAAPGTLLGLGICEQLGVFRGEKFAFLEMFEAVRGPAHVVHVADDALVPSAAVLAEQLARTPEQFEALAADFARSFASASAVPTPADWMFAGALLAALQRSPLTDRYDVLTRSGLRHVGPAEAVVLSLNAEAPFVLRHRRLGYALQCHEFRIAQAGPALRTWLDMEFERVQRSTDDVRRDYRALIEAARARGSGTARGGSAFLVINAMSTSAHENVHCYAPFERPLAHTLGSVRAKELNLMLYDLAREFDVAIVDADAIAAEMGAMNHLPDGVHYSGPLQARVRGEILRILRERGVPGFAADPVR